MILIVYYVTKLQIAQIGVDVLVNENFKLKREAVGSIPTAANFIQNDIPL